jgi:hypothetical protein
MGRLVSISRRSRVSIPTRNLSIRSDLPCGYLLSEEEATASDAVKYEAKDYYKRVRSKDKRETELDHPCATYSLHNYGQP